MVRHTLSSHDACTHQIWDSYLKRYVRYASDKIILKARSDVKVKITVTPKMVCDTPPSQDALSHQIWESYLKNCNRYALVTIILKTRSDVKIKVTVTRKWYATLCNPKMHSYTKVGIPTYKKYRRYAPDSMPILDTRSEAKVNVTVTQWWYATTCHLKMYTHSK